MWFTPFTDQAIEQGPFFPKLNIPEGLLSQKVAGRLRSYTRLDGAPPQAAGDARTVIGGCEGWAFLPPAECQLVGNDCLNSNSA